MKKRILVLSSIGLAIALAVPLMLKNNSKAPIIEARATVESLSGEGTEASPYLIGNAEELDFFRNSLVKIDEGTQNNYFGKFIKLTASFEYALAPQPEKIIFQGTFDGDGHTLTWNTTSTAGEVSLFYCIGEEATVKNLNFDGELTTPINWGASLTSYLQGKAINCNNYATVGNDSGNCFAGLVSKLSTSKGHLLNCNNYGEVYGKQYTGGVMAWANAGGTIENCNNYGDVTGSYESAGGICGLVGQNNATSTTAVKIINCNNFGDISATGGARVAGIGGCTCLGATFEKCSNYGNIYAKGNTGAGGIMGYIWMDSATGVINLTDCYNGGTISSTLGWAGGLFGYSSSSRKGTVNLTKCISAGFVDDLALQGNCGGFGVGQSSGTTVFNLVDCVSIAGIESTGSNFGTGFSHLATNVVEAGGTNLVTKNDKTNADPISDAALSLIQDVRLFCCEKDEDLADDLETSLASLTQNDIFALANTEFVQNANYILNFMEQPDSLGVVSILNSLNETGTALPIFIVIIAVTVVGSLLVIRFRRKRQIALLLALLLY